MVKDILKEMDLDEKTFSPREVLAVISKGAETLQTRLAVPASISDIITGILLFCMLGCEFFINYRLIFRSSKTEKEAAKE